MRGLSVMISTSRSRSNSEHVLVHVRGDPNDSPAAHRADLSLEEPAAQAGLVENVLTVRDLHEVGRHRVRVKLFQTNAAVIVLALNVELVGDEKIHVGVDNVFSLLLI